MEMTVSMMMWRMVSNDSGGIKSSDEAPSTMWNETVTRLPLLSFPSGHVGGLSGRIANPEGKITTVSGFPPFKTMDKAYASIGA